MQQIEYKKRSLVVNLTHEMMGTDVADERLFFLFLELMIRTYMPHNIKN